MATKTRREKIESNHYRERMEGVLEDAFDLLQDLHAIDGEGAGRLEQLLREYLKNNGYTFYRAPEQYMPGIYKVLIRDDADGCISSIKTQYLTEEYFEYSKNFEPIKASKETYGRTLMASKDWNEAKSFASYNAIHGRLVDEFYNTGFDADVIRKMNINDFRHFIRRNLKQEFGTYRQRENIAKKFIANNADEVYYAMKQNAYDDCQIAEMIKKMEDGNIEGVIASKDGGKNIEMTKHHVEPVHNPHNVEQIHNINDFKRIAMIEKRYHKWLHALEYELKNRDGKTEYEKVLTPPNAAFILNFETAVCYDYDNPSKVFQRRNSMGLNLIYLNKIEILTRDLRSRMSGAKQKQEDRGYVAGTGKGSRSNGSNR